MFPGNAAINSVRIRMQVRQRFVLQMVELRGMVTENILQRYLKQTNLDTEEVHRRSGPVDNVISYPAPGF